MDRKSKTTKGQVLVIVALSLILLLAIAGLAIDVGTAYGVKAKLNAAVDAAAIAAGRVTSQGPSGMSTQATNYFNANFPPGLLGATITAGPTTTATQNPQNFSWTVSITATASVPTYFAKIVGWPSFTVTSSATSTVRSLDLILVLDSSLSLGASFPPLQAAAIQFIQNFDTTNDRIGLIHFSSGVVQDVTITTARGFDPTAIANAINAIQIGGGTTTEEALRLAQAQLDPPNIPVGSQNSLRAIVLFTDGAPNAVVGYFCNGVTLPNGQCSSSGTIVPNSPPGAPGALYSETTNGEGFNGDTECLPASCASGCVNPLLTEGGNCGYLEAVRMFAYNQQNTYITPDNCNIQNLPQQDWTGSVNLASYNLIRQLSYDSNGNIINSRCNVNMAARNMVENIANSARSETPIPINIYTIGLGTFLTEVEVDPANCGYGNNELGTNILQRLANVQGVDTYNPRQPSGLYAYAGDASQLNAAFSQVASQILRLSQ